jgi:hypothetical protein
MKKVFVVIALILLPTLVFSAANVRSISVVGNCYIAGQNITVNFQVNANSYQNIYGDIDFSNNTFAAYTDDCVWDSSGAENPPVTTGHNGGFIIAQGKEKKWCRTL